jgi:type I restriction enzyme, S subunit
MNLPKGWSVAPLGELAHVNPRSFDDPPADDDLVSFVPMACVEEESGLVDVANYRQWREVKKGYTPFQDGDVLFAKITPCMENGKYAIVRGLKRGRGTGSTEFHVLRSRPGILPEFILNFLFQDSIRRNARMIMKGAAGQLRVPPEFLGELLLPVPPEREQARIVAEIEKQFTRLTAAVAALRRVQANLKRYRAAVLKAACEGRLVPTEAELARREGRSYEPASALLERILAERRTRRQAAKTAKFHSKTSASSYKEPLQVNETPHYRPPEGWIWCTADQVCLQITDGEHIQPPYTATGDPLLSAKHVRFGYVTLDSAGFIARADFEKALARCAPRKNDILIVSVGATTGRAAIVGDLPQFAIVRSVLLLKPLIDPNYLWAWTQSPVCQRWISQASGATAQPHLYISTTSWTKVKSTA